MCRPVRYIAHLLSGSKSSSRRQQIIRQSRPPRSYNYGALGGAAARGYSNYNRQQNERERYNTNYGGGYNSSYGGGYGGGYSNYGY